MGVKVTNISDSTDDGIRTVSVLDSVGDEYSVQFSEEEETLTLKCIVLPDDTWNVDVFQEVIEVRDEAINQLGDEDDVSIVDGCMKMSQIYTKTAALEAADDDD